MDVVFISPNSIELHSFLEKYINTTSNETKNRGSELEVYIINWAMFLLGWLKSCLFQPGILISFTPQQGICAVTS
jgi:hypothetical protein